MRGKAASVLAAYLALSLVATETEAAPRSRAAKAEFQRQHPCPTSGKPRGACPGFIIDHVLPLCAGGADAPSNMQWQTSADARMKDQREARECLALRRARQER